MVQEQDGAAPEEEEILLPLMTVEDLQQKLSDFLEKNPSSLIETMDIPDPNGGEPHRIPRVSKPWGDPTMAIMLLGDVDELSDALNNVYLPERLSALWHQDTKDLEVIWTALPLSPSQKEIEGRKFVFQFSGKKYKCEFGKSSERLLVIAKNGFPDTNPSATNFRNLQSFSRMKRGEAKEENIEYNPLSFGLEIFV